MKHSVGNSVFISLHQSANETKLLIGDNGKGFAMQTCEREIGIQNMERWAMAFGGKSSVKSAPNYGCAIEVALPVEVELAQKKLELRTDYFDTTIDIS